MRRIGVSNFDRALLETCLAMRHVDSLQPEFSMLAREDAELIRWCGEQGIGVVSYSPLGVRASSPGAITAETRSRIDDWRGGEAGRTVADLAGSLAIVEGLRPDRRAARLRAVAARARLERRSSPG